MFPKTFPYFPVIAFIVGYLIYDWAEAENARLSRKNPKDFENDK